MTSQLLKTLHDRVYARICELCFAGTYLVAIIYIIIKTQNPATYNHDIGWYFDATRKLLNGGSIPQHVFDNNPPLIYWINIPIIWVADNLGLSAFAIYNISTFLLISSSCLAAYYILRSVWNLSPTFSVAFTQVMLFCFVMLTDYNYGQRDHLITILFTPYLLMLAAQATGRAPPYWLRMLLAAAVAMGISIKPHFLIIWLLAELYLYAFRACFKKRYMLFRIENRIIVATGIIYIVSVWVFTPEWFETIKITLNVYDVYSGGFHLWNFAFQLLLFCTIITGVAHTKKLLPEAASLFHILWISALGFYAVAWLQNKGFTYHMLPTIIITLFLIGVFIIATASRLSAGSSAFRLFSPPLFCVMLLGTGLWVTGVEFREALKPEHRLPSVALAEIFRSADPAHNAVFVMSSAVPAAYPAINLAGARSSSRFSCLWIVPGNYPKGADPEAPFPYHTPGQMSSTEAFLIDAVIEDLQKDPPAFIVNDRHRFKIGFGVTSFDYLEYFLRDARFKTFFNDYQFAADIGGYRVYRRTQPNEGV